MHYVSLERDLSNIHDVVAAIKDERLQREITQRTYEEIIGNRALWYEAFVRCVDEAIEERWPESRFAKRFKAAAVQPRKPIAYLLAACDPVTDPRIGWMAETLRSQFDVYEIGILREPNVSLPAVEQIATDHYRIRVPTVRDAVDIFEDPESDKIGSSAGIALLAKFAVQTKIKPGELRGRDRRSRRSFPETPPRVARIFSYPQQRFD